jgi:Putative abortive phage resistance protein AbiGi, antitoxin
MPNQKLHRQQLFHWIGSNLDASNGGPSKRLTDSLRDEYLSYLRVALENGLWAKTPRIPDQLGDGSLVKIHRPITCFTEWSLDQSRFHTRSYGRMGFGFPKRFVLQRGGQPVTYVRDAERNDPYTSALLDLARWLSDANPQSSGLNAKRLDAMRSRFDYLSHFNKRIRKAKPQAKAAVHPKRTGKSDRILTNISISFLKEQPDTFARHFGPTLDYLEEREWRIVFDPSIKKFFIKGPGAPGPDYFIPFEPGKQLFTLVVPDNAILNAVIHDKKIRSALFPKNGPHVTLLSLQDVGTF